MNAIVLFKNGELYRILLQRLKVSLPGSLVKLLLIKEVPYPGSTQSSEAELARRLSPFVSYGEGNTPAGVKSLRDGKVHMSNKNFDIFGIWRGCKSSDEGEHGSRLGRVHRDASCHGPHSSMVVVMSQRTES